MKRPTLILTLALAAVAACHAVPARLPFLFDDYARARAEAIHRMVPVFVDVWAPW